MNKTEKKAQGFLAFVIRIAKAIRFWGWNIFLRPGYEFYYASGFTKAAVTAFTLILNLILFVLLILSWASLLPIDLTSEGQLSSILKRHILWPTNGRLYVCDRPTESLYALHQIVTEKQMEEEIKRLERLQKGLGNELFARPFKVTDALAEDLSLYLKLFLETPLKGTFEEKSFKVKYKEGEHQKTVPLKNFDVIRGTIKENKIEKQYDLEIPLNNDEYEFNLHKRDFVKAPLWFYIAALITAYVSLLLNIRTTVESILTPIPGGPLTADDRQSMLRRILLKIPGAKTLQMNTQIFLMLPVAGLIFFALLEVLGRGLEEIEFGLLGTILTSLLSMIISGGAFFMVYATVVSREISRQNLILGALYGAFLWLVGRWFFTEYIAVSLYRNLKIFSLAFILLTWLYYFCCAMFMGIHLAFILQHQNLKEVVTSWLRKDSDSKSIGSHLLLQQSIHLDLLIKLGGQYENVQKFEINPKGWVNLENIGNYDGFCRSFVNEAVFSFVAACSDLNIIDQQYSHNQKSHYFRFTVPPSEIDVQEIFKTKARPIEILNDFEQYSFAALLKDFILHEDAGILTVKDLMEKMQQNITEHKQKTKVIQREQMEPTRKTSRRDFSKKGPRSSLSGWTRLNTPLHQSIGETKALKLDSSSTSTFSDPNRTEAVFPNPNYTEELTRPKFPITPPTDSYFIPPSKENLENMLPPEKSFKIIYPQKEEDIFAVPANEDALLETTENEDLQEAENEDLQADQFEVLEEDESQDEVWKVSENEMSSKDIPLSEEEILPPPPPKESEEIEDFIEPNILSKAILPLFEQDSPLLVIEEDETPSPVETKENTLLFETPLEEKFLQEEEIKTPKKNLFLESLETSEKIAEEENNF